MINGSEVTVLTVTKRKNWFKRARQQYLQQSVQPRWIIVNEPDCVSRDERMVAEWFTAPRKIRRSNLNASLNHGLNNVRTPYVIFYQDFIDIPKDCFEQLILDVKETGGFVTTATINPDGNHDGRYLGADLLRECPPDQWEANVAIAPMEAIYELGGFDESYDDGWSWDNVNLAERAAMLGYKFYIDERIKPRLLFHVKEPDLDPTIPLNGGYHERRMAEIRAGDYPLQLPYVLN